MKRTLLGLVSGLLVVAALGLGLAWAKPEWVPAWARLGQPAGGAADSGLYCREHGVPEAFCTLCHEELKGKLMLCKEHGDIPEDICTLCHPEVEAKHKIKMCPKGHGLPESFCYLCKPPDSAATEAVLDGWCATHNLPEASCAPCLADPDRDEAACRRGYPVVRLASETTARQIGLETAPATAIRHAHQLIGNAEVEYNANLYAEVRPRVGGTIHEVLTDEGVAERKGDVLAIIDSAAVGTAKADYLAALPVAELAEVTLDRTLSLVRSNAMPQKEELQAKAAANKARAEVLGARQRLFNLGFPETAMKEIARTQDTSSLLKVVSPIEGTIVERHAVAGESVEPTHQLFAVADTRVMWAWIDLDESEVDRVRPGQPVRFTISGTEAPVFSGRVDWIDAAVRPETRTVRVRAELQNIDDRLRAHQFGRAEIQVGDEHDAVVVPRSALQNDGQADMVFLADDERGYRPQRVVARPSEAGDSVEVAWGLKPGQRVVTTGSFLLKSELFRSGFGEGCCKE